MKLRSIALAFIIALTWSGMHAQTLTMHANVPFEFWLDKTVMPAGAYELHYSNGLLQLRGDDASHVFASVFTFLDHRLQASAKNVLQFNRCGGSYFFSSLLTTDLPGEVGLMKSAQEKEILSRSGTTQTALVALRRK